MKLQVAERLRLLQILPTEGNFLTLKIVRELREKLGFDDAEHERLSLEQGETNVKWDTKADGEGSEFEFGLKQTEIIVDTLKKLDSTKTLQEHHLTLYEKFVENPAK